MKKNSYGVVKCLAVGILAVLAGCCDSCGRGTDPVPLRQIEEEASTEETPAQESSVPETSVALCYVHICGEVVRPGVYALEPGQRVCKAVELAGGFTQRAAADYLNLAEPVQDGMKLIVPDQESLLAESPERIYGDGAGAAGAGGSAGDQPAKVNLNTAGEEQLMTLTGIGPARAADIIRYRDEHGRFEQIEDIMKIPGIKDAAFQKIKEDITV